MIITLKHCTLLAFLIASIGSAFAGHQPNMKVDSKDIVQGTGNEVVKHSTVSVHYTGWLADGTMFDSSRSSNDLFKFQLGNGQVIPGWDVGLLGMRVGGKRELIIPPELAYGKRGTGAKIPPNATLKFEVELFESSPPKYRNFSSTELEAALTEGVTLIDIRRPDEWKKTGIIEGSKLLTAFDQSGRFVKSFPDELAKIAPPDAPVILICRTGNRSSALANVLSQKANYNQVINIKDGIVKWIADKKPVTKKL